MDGFGDNIDLDKLLDDFEKSEGSRLSGSTVGVKLPDGTPNTISKQWQTSSDVGAEDGGYFVPELVTNMSDDDGYDCPDGHFIADASDAFSSLASDTYISDGVIFHGNQQIEVPPELLQNSEFGLGDVTSRPSFLSSSPPQITSHPDIVPTRMSLNDAGTPDAVPDVYHMMSDEGRFEPPDVHTNISTGDDRHSDVTAATNQLNALSFSTDSSLLHRAPAADASSSSSSTSSVPENFSCVDAVVVVSSVDSGVTSDVVSSPHIDVIADCHGDSPVVVDNAVDSAACEDNATERVESDVTENGMKEVDHNFEIAYENPDMVGFGSISGEYTLSEAEVNSYLADVHKSADGDIIETTADNSTCSEGTQDPHNGHNHETDMCNEMVDELADVNDTVFEIANGYNAMTQYISTDTTLQYNDCDEATESTDNQVQSDMSMNGDGSLMSLQDELASAVPYGTLEMIVEPHNTADVIDEQPPDASCNSPFSQGARPKQRPNSLLGLSTPFVSPAEVVIDNAVVADSDTTPAVMEVQNADVVEDGSTVANPRPNNLDLPSRDCADRVDGMDTDCVDGIRTDTIDMDCTEGGMEGLSYDDVPHEVSPIGEAGSGDALAQFVHVADEPQAIGSSDCALHETASAMDQTPPRSSVNPDVSITQLGKIAPDWLPDAETAVCMQCEAKFTFTKRRHHCRSCGKIFCSACCSLKSQLEYMEMKEARVCSRCYQDIIRAQVYTRMHASRPPNSSRPSEYCSTIPPQAMACASAQPSTVTVPVGVLRRQAAVADKRGESKQVMFSDGIRPGGDLTELDGSSAASQMRASSQRPGRKTKIVQRPTGGKSSGKTKVKTVKSSSSSDEKPVCFIPAEGLPPVLVTNDSNGVTMQENPVEEDIIAKLRDPGVTEPVVFVINKNLSVLVKLVTLDCCVNCECWNICTRGMCSVSQEEMVVVLECQPDENSIPVDVFKHFANIYSDASKGETVSHLDHTLLTQPTTLGSKEHCGWLYVRPNFQCVQKLLLPPPPYVVAILLQKWETPWAKVFPIRLMLRLGAQYRYYPCPLVSVRFRKPVFAEIGHTIMNLLADFRNYQFTLACVRGVRVHMQDQCTSVLLPRNRYNEVMKMISNSNDFVMAFGATFSTEADSHLVCIQNEDGKYETQAINIQNKPRKITGASFIVFNGALKSSATGVHAKSSIVEDGVMVQISAETLAELRQRLQDMRDYSITCGGGGVGEQEGGKGEKVTVEWVQDDHDVNIGVTSPIDHRAMDGVSSIHIHNSTDYTGDCDLAIRWTHVFFISSDGVDDDTPTGGATTHNEPVDLSRLAEMLAHSFCIALTPHLDALNAAGSQCFGLRATIDTDTVGYEVGSNGRKLASEYMNSLDNELIPVIHNAASFSRQGGRVILELLFHVIH